MNINKLFKIVTILFICTAILALIFGVVALLSDSGKNDEKEKEVSANENPGQIKPIGEDEELVVPKEDKENDVKSADDDVSETNDDSDSSLPVKEKEPGKTDEQGADGKENIKADATGEVDQTPEEKKNETATGNEATPLKTAEGLPIGQSVPIENLKFDGTEVHFVLQNINYQVNVRKEASKSSDKVGELLKGAYGVVIEKGEEFSLVKCGDLTGYIMNNYLMTGRAADEQIQGVSSRKVKIDRAVFIRDDANMESNKIAIAPEGATYSIDPTAPEVHGWVAIVYNDAPKAYVAASFCTVEE